MEQIGPDLLVLGDDAAILLAQHGFFRARSPRPGVAKPQLRQDVDRRFLGPAIVNADAHEHVLGAGLRVFDEDVEVAVVIEDARVEQFELRLVPAAAAILLQELSVREFPLRILVKHPQTGVRGRRVEIVINLLHILAMITLGVGEAEQSLFEDRVVPVPQCERQAQALAAIADPANPVLAPMIGAAAGMVVREVIPRVATGGIIFAHRAPLALGEIRPPEFPVSPCRCILGQALGFGVDRFEVFHRGIKATRCLLCLHCQFVFSGQGAGWPRPLARGVYAASTWQNERFRISHVSMNFGREAA